MKVIIVKTNNTFQVKEITKSLESLKNEVGGWIEHVRPNFGYSSKVMPKGTLMIVDEEGLCKRKALNNFGTYIYSGPFSSQPIVGDLILPGELPYGEDYRSLTDCELTHYKSELVRFGLKEVDECVKEIKSQKQDTEKAFKEGFKS